MPASLESIPIFTGLTPEALRLLQGLGSESSVEAGRVILREGETSNRLFVVRRGTVRVCKRFGEADAVELATLRAGDFFGEMCLLETLPRVATVQAVSDAELFSLSSMVFLQLYERMPRQYGVLMLNLARDLSRRLRRLDETFAARH